MEKKTSLSNNNNKWLPPTVEFRGSNKCNFTLATDKLIIQTMKLSPIDSG